MRPSPGGPAQPRRRERCEVGRRVDVREPRGGRAARRRRRARRSRRGSRAARRERLLERRQGAAAVGARERAGLRDGGVAAGGGERAQVAGLEQRAVDREREHERRSRAARSPATSPAIGARTPIPSSLTGNGRPAASPGLPKREPLVADLAEQPPRALGERLVAEAGERLGRAEAAALAADEQRRRLGRLSRRHGAPSARARRARARRPRRRASRRRRPGATRSRSSSPTSAFIAAVGMNLPTLGTSPKSRLSTTKHPGEQRDHGRDVVAEDRAEPDADPGPERRADDACRAGAARRRGRRGERRCRGRERIGGRSRTRAPRRRAPNASPASEPAASFAPTTRERCGVKRKVGRIVPKRYSLAITSTPASAAKRLASWPMPSRLRWFSARASENASLERARQHHEQQHEADQAEQQAERRPRRADLQQLGARLGDHGCGSEVSSRKTCSSEEPCGDELVQDDARRRPRSRRRGRSSCRRRAARRRRRPSTAMPSRASASCSVGGLRAAHAHRAAEPRRQLVERRLGDEPAAVDDQHAVDGLRDLGQHVARHEHRPAARRERAQEVAQPAHALRVEPVGRLVEDEQLRLAEQRRREAEPLPHAERVALDPAPRRALEARRCSSTSSARESGRPAGARRA